jgi:hypothetical protein
MAMWSGAVRAAGTVLAVVLVAGCTTSSGSGSGAPGASGSSVSSTAGTPSTSPSASATDPRELALAAYRGMWEDMATAAETSDYQSPLLGRHASGDALVQIKQSLYADKKAGLVTKGRPVLSPRVQSLTSEGGLTRVAVADCADDTHWLKYVAATGKLQDDEPGGKHAVTAQVVGKSGSWVVVQFLVRPVGTC